MTSTLCIKWLNIFLPKSSIFCTVRTIQFCSNYTSMWSKYLSNNVWRDFRLPMSASAMVTWITRSENRFLQYLPLKLFPATVANADIESLKSLHTLFSKYMDHTLVKFEQNCKVQTTRNFELFDKKPGFSNHFWQSVDAILEDVSVA